MTAILNPTGPAPFTPPARPVPAPAAPPARDATPPPAPVPVPVGPVLELPGTPTAALVPVTHRGRPVGAFVLHGGRVRYRPVFDPDRLLGAAAGVLAVGLAAAGVAALGRRRPPAIGALSMGPGGWVSLKGLPLPAPRAPRPWWARALRARRLVVER
ncbi:hypothetical protein GA0070606_0989 [Micromonospora citrea]|uniref:Uncharacterized protein n=1 Tax=Micromonospora citrea TaxID=47855 RepID=A0A1C6TXC0_9ACTN|nr:hypothetical protein [Micromonospora citrea]SCL46446.1 hypothetical protein GA0070606_0989 [Micromonospora citrea]